MRGSTATRRRFGAWIAVVALAGTVVAGLATTAGAAPLNESQWKKQANAICTTGNQETAALFQQYFGNLQRGQEPDPATVAAYVAVFAPAIQSQIDAVDALPEPTKLKAKVSTYLATARAALATLKANPSLLTMEPGPFDETFKLAKKLGLKQCA